MDHVPSDPVPTQSEGASATPADVDGSHPSGNTMAGAWQPPAPPEGYAWRHEDQAAALSILQPMLDAGLDHRVADGLWQAAGQLAVVTGQPLAETLANVLAAATAQLAEPRTEFGMYLEAWKGKQAAHLGFQPVRGNRRQRRAAAAQNRRQFRRIQKRGS